MNKLFFTFFLLSCTPLSTLPCEMPEVISSRDTYTQALCADWPYGDEVETAVLLFFERDTLLATLTITGSPFSVTIPAHLIGRTHRSLGHRTTHLTVYHNHVYEGAHPSTINPGDLKALGLLRAKCMELGITLHDFVVFKPGRRIVSARHGGYLP